MREMSSRCHLVYALAPAGVSAREANDLLGVSLDELVAAESDDPRYWWKRAS